MSKKDLLCAFLIILVGAVALYNMIWVPMHREYVEEPIADNVTVFEANPETGEFEMVHKAKVLVSVQDGREQVPTTEETGSISINFRLPIDVEGK